MESQGIWVQIPTLCNFGESSRISVLGFFLRKGNLAVTHIQLWGRGMACAPALLVMLIAIAFSCLHQCDSLCLPHREGSWEAKLSTLQLKQLPWDPRGIQIVSELETWHQCSPPTGRLLQFPTCTLLDWQTHPLTIFCFLKPPSLRCAAGENAHLLDKVPHHTHTLIAVVS